MVERGLRGGMCQVSNRKAEANNKYMNELYDENKPSSYINYLDANKLYGLAMCQKLPYKDLEFINYKMEVNDIMEYEDVGVGYTMDVDLEYPDNIHDYHTVGTHSCTKDSCGHKQKLLRRQLFVVLRSWRMYTLVGV